MHELTQSHCGDNREKVICTSRKNRAPDKN